jgi:rhodanese-related sulfurtransferase
MIQNISLDDLRQRLAAGQPTTLVEALPQRYYDDGHMPGAIQIDHDRVHDQAPVRLPEREAFIVVYCASSSCRNSNQAAAALVALGYRAIHLFAGGKEAWLAAGLELEQARAA